MSSAPLTLRTLVVPRRLTCLSALWAGGWEEADTRVSGPVER